MLQIAKSAMAGVLTAAICVGCNVLSSEKRGSNRPRVQPAGENVRLIRSDYQKGEIERLCSQAIASFRQDVPGFTNAYDFEYALTSLGDELNPMIFMAYVSTNADLRDEGSRCEEDAVKFDVELFTNRDLYEIVKATETNSDAEARLVSELVRKFENNGMALSEADLERFKDIKSRLATLEAQFSKNLNEDTSSVLFTREELEGVSESFFERLKRGDGGLYLVTTKTADYTHVMDNASNAETRRRLQVSYENRAADANTPLLEQAVLLRQELAGVMGYDTWADYRTNGRMAENAGNVRTLLGDLQEKLQPRLRADMDRLLSAKKTDDPSAERLDAWDVRYYANQVKKREYSLDDEVIRQYFPKDRVMEGVFNIYQTILGVRYVEVPNADVWHSDVKLYEIRDDDNNELLAYFYTDFFPREGKYGHAAAFPLIAGRVMADGNYSIPVASIVSNFTPPSESRPSLLTHDEVETLFHEFGHIMHQVLTTAPYGFLSGTNVAQDFVEAPSQMLENWAWDPEMLTLISGHYERADETLPADLIAKMVAAKDFNIGYFYSRQIVLGTTDLILHTSSGAVDVNETYKQVHRDILGVEPLTESRWMASFGHMMGGYDAGYYGYIWSEVYAADMFTAFAEHGLLDPVVGRSYRTNILESGAMREPLELIAGFLGRQPNNKAFLKKLGIE